MRQYIAALFILCISVIAFGCTASKKKNSWFAKNDKVKVLSTIGVIGDLVEKIGGPYVASEVLIQGQLDPHSYELVKGDAEKLAFADLIFCNGLGLEHGASLKYQLSTNDKTVVLGNTIPTQKLIRVERVVDPHIWMDAKLFASICEPIAHHLSLKDPKHRKEFFDNAIAVRKELLDVHFQIEKKLSQIPDEQRYLVTSHDAFRYFVRAYFATDEERSEETWYRRLASPQGLAPEGQISSADIAAIVDFVHEHQVHVVFPESNLSKKALHKVVDVAFQKEVDLTVTDDVLYGDVMYKTYKDTLLYNTEVILKNLHPSWEGSQ